MSDSTSRPLRPLLGISAGVLLAGSLTAAPAMADSHDGGGTAILSVLHGVPDLTVDVYLDGELALDDFAPGDLAGPLEVPAGDAEIAITAADAEDDSEPAIGPVTVTLEEGVNHTAVAHLDADGQPTASAFVNDTSEVSAGEGRLTVRHTAAAPAVDVWADGDVVLSDVENTDEAVLDLPAGTLEAAVSVAGETDPVIGPADVDVAEGANTIVYAWGSAEDGNLALATQVIGDLHSAPDGVPAGNVQVGSASQTGWITLGAVSLAAMAAGSILWVRRPATARS